MMCSGRNDIDARNHIQASSSFCEKVTFYLTYAGRLFQTYGVVPEELAFKVLNKTIEAQQENLKYSQITNFAEARVVVATALVKLFKNAMVNNGVSKELAAKIAVVEMEKLTGEESDQLVNNIAAALNTRVISKNDGSGSHFEIDTQILTQSSESMSNTKTLINQVNGRHQIPSQVL